MSLEIKIKTLNTSATSCGGDIYRLWSKRQCSADVVKGSNVTSKIQLRYLEFIKQEAMFDWCI